MERAISRRTMLMSPVVLVASARSIRLQVKEARASTVPVGVPGQWTLALNDEFDGPRLDRSLWNTQYPWGEDNNGDGSENCYLAGNAVVDGHGHLNLIARLGPVSGTASDGKRKSWRYSSGQVNTFNRYTFTYGVIEMRAKVPKGSGSWPAFWALPADGTWPPEVDVMEIYGNAPNVLEMTYHEGSSRHHQEQHAIVTLPSPADFAEDFHTYGCCITSDAITWYLDGVERWSLTNKRTLAQHKELYVVCNLAVGGLAGDPSANKWPQEYVVDYIRAWKPPTPPTS